TYIVNVYVQLAAASHSTFMLCLGNCCQSKTTTRNDDHVFYFDIFEHLEINPITRGRIRRRQISCEPKFNWSPILQAERKWLFERCSLGLVSRLLILCILF